MEKTLTVFLEKIRLKIKSLKSRGINEAQTKEWLIKPFFESLGWDFSNPDEIVPEDDDSTGRRPDYCFYVNKAPKLLVEAKALSNSLDDNKMIMEKLNYCANSGTSLLIITNGETYKIYYSELKGTGKDKLLQEFSIFENYDDELIDKLSRKSFDSDILLNYAKNLSILTNVKKALEKNLHSSSKKFIGIINETVKEILGHKFGDDEIELALKQFSVTINSDFYFSNSKESIENEKDNGQENKWTVMQQFRDGKWKESQDLYSKLIKGLKNIGLQFTENPMKFYIGLISADSINFCQIHGQKSGLKIWLNLDYTELSEEEGLKVRDVSKIGHWGMGDVEAVISNTADIEWLINLIKKAYQKYYRETFIADNHAFNV